MHINGRIVGSIAGSAPAAEARTERITGAQPTVPPGSGAYDTVVISEAGRALSQDARVADLPPHHEEMIRQRIVDGAYDSLEIVDQVARRILESGDL